MEQVRHTKHRNATRFCDRELEGCKLSIPSTIILAVDMKSKNFYAEFRNEYKYAPVYCDELWFHSAYHAVQYFRFHQHPRIAEDIRLSKLKEDVDKIVNVHKGKVSDTDDSNFKSMSNSIINLLIAKFTMNTRMYHLIMQAHGSDIRYDDNSDFGRGKAGALMSTKLKETASNLVNQTEYVTALEGYCYV